MMDKTIFKVARYNPITLHSITIGTGFFVSYKNNVYFVTASHVFEDSALEDNEKYVLISSTVIKNNKILFSELKQNVILTRKNSCKTYDYDIAIGILTSLPLFEDQDYGVNVIDIDDGYYKIERDDHVEVCGYPSFYVEQFKDCEVTKYVPPYCFKSKVVETGFENYIVMDNNTGILNYGGMSGAPVFIEGKLAGVFNAGTQDIDGNPKLLFCRIGFLAYLLTYHYKFLNH